MGTAVSRDAIGPAVDRSAACVLAAAVGWACLVLLDAEAAQVRWTIAIASAVAGWYAACALMGWLSGEQLLPLPQFDPAELEFSEWVDSSGQPDDGSEDELLLDDVFSAAPDTSHVIRLFDPAQMPTAGELHERIDRHLASGPHAVPDSTQELYAALSALRQTLR